MKQIGRTIIILVAAALVCGAAYALAGNRASGFDRQPPGFEQQAGGANGPATGASRRPGGFEGRGERGGNFLGGVFEVLRSLLIVAVVATLALPVVRLFTRRRAGSPAEGEDIAAP